MTCLIDIPRSGIMGIKPLATSQHSYPCGRHPTFYVLPEYPEEIANDRIPNANIARLPHYTLVCYRKYTPETKLFLYNGLTRPGRQFRTKELVDEPNIY